MAEYRHLVKEAGSPEATDEFPGEEGGRFRALAGNGAGRKMLSMQWNDYFLKAKQRERHPPV
ncbi:MAG: hypothetical protein ACYDCX_04685 [Acidithiobacillus sp.]